MHVHSKPQLVLFEEKHIPAALALWTDTEGIGLSSADSPAALGKFLAHNEGLSFCAIEADEDGVIGTVLCGTDGRRGYIHHLAVAAHRRQAGIGRTLLARALDGLAKRGIAKCHAFVFYDNPDGQQFWQASGWQRRADLLVYSKSLDGGS